MKNNNIIVIGKVLSSGNLTTNPAETPLYQFEIVVSDDKLSPEIFTFICRGIVAITASKIAKEGQSLTVHGRAMFSPVDNQWLFFAESVGLNLLSHLS